MTQNPFAINFGVTPVQYISREIIIDEIVDNFQSEIIQNPCVMLTGNRGTGKTVTMTSVEKRLSKEKDFIIIRLNPTRDMLVSLVGKLYDSRDYISQFVDGNINLSAFGIGVNLSSNAPVADIESALEKILKEIKKNNKKLLISIDEVSNTQSMREFASCFQLLLREELPVCLIMAGLYENIHNLENVDNLTFLYRTPKYEMEPLNLQLVKKRYADVFKIDQESAWEMAVLTKGYPFAYQALGKYVWESEEKAVTQDVIDKYDEALSHYVYKKIWSELSEKDKWYMSYIVKKDKMSTAELLELTGQKKNEFSQYRTRLSEKGLIDISNRGVVAYTLPRFDVFIQQQQFY